MMQTGLVRSDHGHVLFSVFPMIFLCGSIAMDDPQSGPALSIVPPLVAIVATVALAHPYPMFMDLQSHVKQSREDILTCPPGLQEFDHACLSAGAAQLFSRVSASVHLHAAPGDQIAVFPYETAFGLASRHQVAGGLLQSYLANGQYLTGLDLAGLRQSSPRFALYLPDGIISVPIDGVPSFTRGPDVWFYFLRNYRAESAPVPGVVALSRDDSRNTRLTFTEFRAADPMPWLRITRRSTSLELSPIDWPAAGADFLKLRIRLDYPIWWRLRKPSALTLKMSFADGSQKLIQFVVEPNRWSDIWLYPWDEKQMGRYFSADESDCGAGIVRR